MHHKKLTVGASIRESYRFLATHMDDFFRLASGPLFLWVVIKLTEQILLHEKDITFNSIYLLNLVTASFAIAWYRQYLLGAQHATYGQLLKSGFNGRAFSIRRFGRTLMRILMISLALLVPTLVLSISLMVYYQGQGVFVSEELIQQLAVKSTMVVMIIFSPILVRLSLFTAGLALGRTSLNFSDIWKSTRGYTITLWWVALRAFLPLALYTYVLTLLLHKTSDKLDIHYIATTLLIEGLAGALTFVMLAIVVAANAEAFRILIGVRDGDAPHRKDAGPRRDNAVKISADEKHLTGQQAE
ncbi:hypothetical protein [Paremcibacter congregatus]|nr:hypothetical protein [Paremcibacter congregatus]QDE28729.1 hypothetical protein FIV45_16350 [Paremcibacter congregatus]